VSVSFETPTRSYLAIIDARGRLVKSVLLNVANEALTTDSLGNAIVAGRRPIDDLTGELVIEKYSKNGELSWSKSYPYSGDVPRLVSRDDDHLLLAAALRGAAKFGAAEYDHRATLPVHCAGEAEACPYAAPGHALLVVDLDAQGEAVKSRLFGSPKSSLEVSGAAVLPSGSLAVTGEFQGAPLALGSQTLCELEPGLPAGEPLFESKGGRDLCSCSKDARDLYLLLVDDAFEPRWTQRAVGSNEPEVAASSDGSIFWSTRAREMAAAPSEPMHLLWWLSEAGSGSRPYHGMFGRLAVSREGDAYASNGLRLGRIALHRGVGL
jgi:hypothetical protein